VENAKGREKRLGDDETKRQEYREITSAHRGHNFNIINHLEPRDGDSSKVKVTF
jgi:hypothetical protein